VDKGAELAGCGGGGMVGEADKRRGGERRRGRVYLQSASQSVKGGIMSDDFPSSTFRLSHCH